MKRLLLATALVLPLLMGAGTIYEGADDGGGAGGGGATSPAGSNTQIQFNNSGSFGGSAQLTFNDSTDTAEIGDASNPGELIVHCDGTANECVQALEDNTSAATALCSADSGETNLGAEDGELYKCDDADTVPMMYGSPLRSETFTIRKISSAASSAGLMGQCIKWSRFSGIHGNYGDNVTYAIADATTCVAAFGSLPNNAGGQALLICPSPNGCVVQSMSFHTYGSTGAIAGASCKISALVDNVEVASATRVQTTDLDGIPESEGTCVAADNCFGDNDGVFVEINSVMAFQDMLAVEIDTGTKVAPSGTAECQDATLDNDVNIRGEIAWYVIPPA